VIILDKTGTITVGNRQAVEFIPFERHTEKEVGEAAFLSSWHDDTPEGRSLIRLAYEDGFVPRELNALGVSEVYEFPRALERVVLRCLRVRGSCCRKVTSQPRTGRLRRKFEAHEEAGSVIGEDETEIIKELGRDQEDRSFYTSNFDALVDRISGQGTLRWP